MAVTYPAAPFQTSPHILLTRGITMSEEATATAGPVPSSGAGEDGRLFGDVEEDGRLFGDVQVEPPPHAELVTASMRSFRGPSLAALAGMLGGCRDDERLRDLRPWLDRNVFTAAPSNTATSAEGIETTAVIDALLHDFSLRDFFKQRVIPGPEGDSHPQGSEQWLESRLARLSGSTAAGAAGLSYPFGKVDSSGQPMAPGRRTVRDALLDRIFPKTLTGLPLQWGSANEPIAQQVAEEIMRDHVLRQPGAPAVEKVLFTYPGGVPIWGRPWFLASVDGLAHVTYADGTREVILIELKCPIGQHFYEDVYSTPLPPAYFCQIQCYMGFLRLHAPVEFASMRRCLFVQWTKRACSAAVFPFEEDFFTQSLLPRLESYYFNHVLPRLALRRAGLIFGGALNVPRMSKKTRARSRTSSSVSLSEAEAADDADDGGDTSAFDEAFLRCIGAGPEGPTGGSAGEPPRKRPPLARVNAPAS